MTVSVPLPLISASKSTVKSAPSARTISLIPSTILANVILSPVTVRVASLVVGAVRLL